MGVKGDKLTKASEFSAELLIEKLASIKGISSKKMFGGHGIFHEGKMFCMINSKGEAFLKANDSNVEDFEKAGADKHSKMPYYTIPEKVMKDNKTFVTWAKKSIKASK